MPIKTSFTAPRSLYVICFSEQYLALFEMLKFGKFTFYSEFAALQSSARKFSY